jgi:ArsR family transcriptional regulator, arsenate/arsenite/antimonite-responsive transcriptional repressor
MGETGFNSLERLFAALCDKTRLRLLGLMAQGEVSVNLLAESLNESQPKISRHLAYLRSAGVVNTRRDGKWIYYSIASPRDVSIREILESVTQAMALSSGGADHGGSVNTPKRTSRVKGGAVNIYVQADMNEELGESVSNIYNKDVYDNDEPEMRSYEEVEMDVFLL